LPAPSSEARAIGGDLLRLRRLITIKEDAMVAYDVLRKGKTQPLRHNPGPRRQTMMARLLGAASVVGIASLLHADPAQAQQKQWQPLSPGYVQCPAPLQRLLRIPEFVSQKVAGKDYGVLRGTVLLQGAAIRMYLGAQDPSQCQLQAIRQFVGVGAALPGYQGTIPYGYSGYTPPPSYPGYAPLPPSPYQDPVPGPTLRARVGDIVELTFLNQLGGEISWNTLDRGEKGQGCDQGFSRQKGQTTNVYPGLDEFPDCFHGSTTGNIHFHGTHTNPQTTGDNVFIEVRPSLRDADGQPVVTEAVVKPQFDEFFANCQRELEKNALAQWPTKWSDMPAIWRSMQEYLLKRYDLDPVIVNKLWPVDEAQIKQGAWPQYYIGATPYCFRLPAYTETTWPPKESAHPSAHGPMMHHAAAPVIMGQTPGTHWYHAHKHGSTTLNVENGMTGVFIIEGGYDDALNQFYGEGWTRTQPVLLINELGSGTNLFGGGTPRVFSVNGRIEPLLTMGAGEVQLWRIADNSARSGLYISGFGTTEDGGPTPTQVFTWRQTAQDGVQFSGDNYWNSKNAKLFASAGNRVDLLVQAPPTPGRYYLFAQEVRSRCETLPYDQIPTIPTVQPPKDAKIPPYPKPSPKEPFYPTKICGAQTVNALLAVDVTPTAATGNQSQFIPKDQVQKAFPPFLTDIGDDEVKGTKTVVFESTSTGGNPGAMHMIDGHKFDGNVGEVVLLNTVEEWKIVNSTKNGGMGSDNGKTFVTTTDPPGVVDHPFHIHINPFQITEVFDPNEVLPNGMQKYVPMAFTPTPPKLPTGQCPLFYDKPETWKPCDPFPKTNLIWWDVFAIPSARAVFYNNNTQEVTVPGYFKMRSRFVDYAGQYVLHCHILAHEDRGMMTVVEVVPFTTPYSHQ
jgi:FtsP/CotA-like multicopper oxidase with cupredoxin domain